MGKKSTFSHLLFIILLGILVYSNTLNVPFHFDDEPNIVENYRMRDLSNFWPPSGTRYIGLLSFAINYKLHGLKVMGYHVFNLIVHLINGVLVYWLVILTFRTPFFMVRQFGKLTAHHDNAVTLSHEPVEWSKGHPFTHSPIHPFTDSPSVIAFFSALFFVSHPIQTQAVTYIVQRFTSLATMFYLLSIVMYIKARLTPSLTLPPPRPCFAKRGRRGGGMGGGAEAKVKFFSTSTLTFYFLSVVFAILAMKTKEIAFTLPIVIVLYEFMFFSDSQFTVHGSRFTVHASRLLFLLPLLLTLLIIPLSLIGTDKPIGDMIGELRKAAQETEEIPRSHYLYTQFRVIVTYIRLLFLPVNQNLDYDYPVYRSFFEPQIMLSFLFLLSIFGLGVYLFYRSRLKEVHSSLLIVHSNPPSSPLNLRGEQRGVNSRATSHELRTISYERLISFGIFWFFITLSVESSIIPIRDVIYEHRMYLPSIGIIIAFSTAVFYVFQFISSSIHRFTLAPHREAGVTHSPIHPFIAPVLLATVIILLSITTYARNSVWKDDISFWQDVIKKSPNKVRSHVVLGGCYLRHSRFDEAITEYRTVLRLNPAHTLHNAVIHNNIGVIYFRVGRFDDAIKEYKAALKLYPDSDLAHFNLGNVYFNQGYLNKAIREYQAALKINPDFPDVHNNLGNVYLKDGRIAEAIREYQTAIKINPGFTDAHINLGIIYFEQGRLDEAAEKYMIALKLNPDSFDAHLNLGDVYFKRGDIDRAIKEYRMALRINPDSSEAYANLGRCLSQKRSP